MDNLNSNRTGTNATIRISHKPDEVGGKFNANHRKEDSFYKEIAAYSVGGDQLVVARLYGNGTRKYACVWIHCPAYAPCLRHAGGPMQHGFDLKGSGYAGGGGYCKPSAALVDAFQNAGITFNENLAGAGLGKIEDAIRAICEALGFERLPRFYCLGSELTPTSDIATANYFFITGSHA